MREAEGMMIGNKNNNKNNNTTSINKNCTNDKGHVHMRVQDLCKNTMVMYNFYYTLIGK